MTQHLICNGPTSSRERFFSFMHFPIFVVATPIFLGSSFRSLSNFTESSLNLMVGGALSAVGTSLWQGSQPKGRYIAMYVGSFMLYITGVYYILKQASGEYSTAQELVELLSSAAITITAYAAPYVVQTVQIPALPLGKIKTMGIGAVLLKFFLI